MMITGESVHFGARRTGDAVGRFVAEALPPGDRVVAIGNVHLGAPPVTRTAANLGSEIFVMILSRRVVMFMPVGTLRRDYKPRDVVRQVQWFAINDVERFEYSTPGGDHPSNSELLAHLAGDRRIAVYPCSDLGLQICEMLAALQNSVDQDSMQDDELGQEVPQAGSAHVKPRSHSRRMGIRKPAGN